MKKLTVLLAGIAVILLAGGVENALAEDSQSVFSGNTLSGDSLKALSLQAKAKTHFIYVDPGPAKPGKVAGEFLAGGIGAVLTGAGLAGIGYGIGHEESSGWLDFDVGGFVGAAVGYLVGSNVGCAAGVTLVGNTGGEKGSYWASFGGSLVGTVVGGLFAYGMASASEHESALAPAIVLTSAQAGGATLFFNQSRKRKLEMSSGALLNLEQGRLSVALPQANISHHSSGSSDYTVNLFGARF